ncbi:hypothetical protein [Brassicibacter mesophilus]|uniref:hypothetical protein n=1 Tax=Brassicibacter mesophilus TaxID=745119 RepID=UPI003D1E0FC6
MAKVERKYIIEKFVENLVLYDVTAFEVYNYIRDTRTIKTYSKYLKKFNRKEEIIGDVLLIAQIVGTTKYNKAEVKELADVLLENRKS